VYGVRLRVKRLAEAELKTAKEEAGKMKREAEKKLRQSQAEAEHAMKEGDDEGVRERCKKTTEHYNLPKTEVTAWAENTLNQPGGVCPALKRSESTSIAGDVHAE